MSLHVAVSIHQEATVLRLTGAADPAGVAASSDMLAAAGAGTRLVVIDLDGTAAAAPDGLHDLVSAFGADLTRLHLVARRNSLIDLLTQARVHHRVAVHRSLDEAVAAHRAATGRR